MPYYHCKKCQHEWEYSKEIPCDWCGTNEPIILEEETPMEKLLKNSKELIDYLIKVSKRE